MKIDKQRRSNGKTDTQTSLWTDMQRIINTQFEYIQRFASNYSLAVWHAQKDRQADRQADKRAD